MEAAMRPTTAFNDNVIDLDALLHPGTAFEHPRDVVSRPDLSLSEKRAILASWASDASAIAWCPSLRAPEGLKGPVTIDEILEALCALDKGPRHPPGRQADAPAAGRTCRGLRRACLRRRDATFSPQAGQCDKVSMGTLRDHESCGEPASEA